MSDLKTFDDYKDLDYLTIIPSKGRSAKIDRVQELFPNAILYIHESEYEDYKPFSKLNIITHKETKGYGSVLNSIFKNCVKSNIKYSAVFDDDKFYFYSLVGNRPRPFDSEQIEQAIVNGCQILEDSDKHLYLFSTQSSVIKYQQGDPFHVGMSLPQGALIHRNSEMHRYRTGMYYYEDFNFCMEYILKHRYIITELRYLCISKGELNEGGCNSFRTSKNEESSKKYIQERWGSHAGFIKNASGNIRPKCLSNRKK